MPTEREMPLVNFLSICWLSLLVIPKTSYSLNNAFSFYHYVILGDGVIDFDAFLKLVANTEHYLESIGELARNI